ncbi:DUF6082 family protein [Actinoplanes missouriensis]|uniref:DUF6082 family protein n=1 Tax=Actinoplanes missouriensis TaxID=1866 RepID=UPI0033D5F267
MSNVPEPVIGSKRTSRVWLAVGISCAVILASVLIASVLVMLRISDSTLNRLSDTGQAFGIFSTLFSAAALMGVALSVTYQSRQNKRYDYEAWHTAHAGLLARVIEDPGTFGPCIGNPARFDSEVEARRYYFTTLWLNFGQIGLRAGNMTEASIRDELCGEMFESQMARDLWIKRREILTRAYGGLSPFYQLVDEEFERTQRAAVEEDEKAKAMGAEVMDEAASPPRMIPPPA